MKTALYRHFDAEGTLLYVGISSSPARRLAEHIAESEWGASIGRFEFEWHPNRSDAALKEALVIQAEMPIWNAVHDLRGLEAHLRKLSATKPAPNDELTLSEWLKVKCIKRGQIAKYLGVSAPYMSDICNLYRSPGLKTAIAIEDFTMGEVTARGLLTAYQTREATS